MAKKLNGSLHQLMETEDAQLAKLHQIIRESIEEESLVTTKVLEEANKQHLSLGERIADQVAAIGGSWRFIICFFLVLMAWITLNTFVLTQHPFDPYPYILLNLVLSCVAAFQAPVIMMSQNSQEIKDRKRAENDYVINLKTEIELRHLHEKIDLLMEEQNAHLFKIQQEQLAILENLQADVKKLKKV